MKLLETQLEKEKNPSIFYGFLWFLYLLPILATFGFIKILGVDVPIWADQWALVDLFEAIAEVNLPSVFGELWELNNNHRMIFPKLIFAATAFLSNWNIIYELYWSFGLATLSFFILYKLAELTTQTTSIFLFHTINLMTCLLMFSWVQYTNWLWGFQIALFLINFCVILASFILAYPPFNPQTKLKLAGILCIIASFSSAQGLVSWLALIPSILTVSATSPGQRIKRFILWLMLFCVSSFAYSIQYSSVPITEYYETVNYDSIWHKLRVYTHFFLNVVAAPLTKNSAVSLIFGLIIISCFVFLILRFWVQRPSILNPFRVVFFSESAPWLSIGLFSILCSLLMTISRADLGADYGLTTSRYTTHSILLLIAILHLFNLHLSLKEQNSTPQTLINKILAFSFSLGLITSLIWMRSSQSLTTAKTKFYQPSNISHTCLYLINYLDLENSQFFENSPANCFVSMVPTTVGLSQQVETLKKINFRKFAKDMPFVEEPSQVHGFISSPWTTEKTLTIPIGGSVRIDGWAVLPNQPKQPQLVFLSTNDNQSFFANAYVNLPSPDVVQFLNSEKYKNSRWDITFPSEDLTSGDNIIKAWVYDPKDRQFVKLAGEIQIYIQ
jgi:hypothetical protein